MKILATSSLLLFCTFLFAQTKLNYSWEKPEYTKCSEKNKAENELIIFERRIAEFYYDPVSGNLSQIIVLHKKVQVNSDDAISGFNKLYLPSVTKTKTLENHKARVITKDGKVVELDKSAVKTAKDQETNKESSYFAFEGVEKGSQIEYFYIIKQSPDYKGTNYTYQSDIARETVEFILISPKNLLFEFKPLNNAVTPTLDTSMKDMNVYVGIDKFVPKVSKEPMGMYYPNLRQIMYKLQSNTATNKSNIVNYSDVALFVHDNIYTQLTKDDTKALQKIIKLAGIESNDAVEDKIYKFEHYIKKNIAFTDINIPTLDNITEALKQKVATELGAIRIFANAYKLLNIDHTVILTCDRNEQKFDQKFESYDFLEHYLLHFPACNKYLDPTQSFFRLGLIPEEYINNYGLFISSICYGGKSYGTSKIAWIEAPSKDHTYDKKFVEVSFSDDLASNTIMLKKEMFGYYANSYQPYFELVDNTVKKELQEKIIQYMTPKGTIESMVFENDKSDCIARKPLTCNARISTTEFIENAGNKILFKVGDLIGPQFEMYQENERTLPIENDFNRTYYRELVIHIPAGYTIENPNEINIEKKCQEKDGTVTSIFSSRYEYNKQTNTIKIIVDEWYNQIAYPIEEYETYRAVINAAADFNKVVFVLKKI